MPPIPSFDSVDAKLLIDAIVRQTTVLIAQLSSTAGIRAPLSHVADEIFLNLSQELEDQGVSRKVVADMFGMALRGYQRRVQRLRTSQPVGGRTLWQDVLRLLHDAGQLTRLELLNRFRGDDPGVVAAVLADLARTGLVSKTGSGPAATYSVTAEEALKLSDLAGKDGTTLSMVWLDVCQNPGTVLADVCARVHSSEAEVERAVDHLCREGRLERRSDGTLMADPFVVPVGAEEGWEVAVFDHFQAVAGAIVAKLRHGIPQSVPDDTTGGATLTFEISAGHALREEVVGLLAEMRRRTDEVWAKVQAENERSPIPENDIERVVFYFGQFLRAGDEDV